MIEEYQMRKRSKAMKEYAAKMKIEPREWKREELREFDGKDAEKPVLVGVDGDVWNVWRGRDFYGEGAAYNAFAGRDATRLLVKYIIEDAEDDGEPLSAMDSETLNGWKDLFRSKYDNVGPLLNSAKDVLPELITTSMVVLSCGNRAFIDL